MKAYLVLDLTIHDFAGFGPYIAGIPAFIEKHSGKYIVQGVQPTTMEGDWSPERMVVIEFPNAEAFLSDPDCQDLFAFVTRRRRANSFSWTGVHKDRLGSGL
jgi:uncharacterized protein (DUF1330 family)